MPCVQLEETGDLVACLFNAALNLEFYGMLWRNITVLFILHILCVKFIRQIINQYLVYVFTGEKNLADYFKRLYFLFFSF